MWEVLSAPRKVTKFRKHPATSRSSKPKVRRIAKYSFNAVSSLLIAHLRGWATVGPANAIPRSRAWRRFLLCWGSDGEESPRAIAANKNLPRTPINIVELHGNNLPGAKAETGEEKKKRVVATAHSRVPITTAKHADNFFGSDVSRKSGQTLISNRGNGRRQVHLQFPTLKKKAEEGAESGRHQLGPSAAHGPGMPQDKAGNIARPHYF